MDRHDHVDGQGEDIPLEPALGGPLMAKTTAEEVTSDQPSFRLLPKKDNENNGAYGGGGKYSGARKGSDKTIDMLYMKVIYWGAFRWIVSWVVFGISVSIVASGAVPVVVPYAAFNLVCACVNIILMGPLLRHSASATNPRPPTLWLARQTLLIVLWIASVAISIAMVVQTYEYAGEKDSMRKWCYGTKTGRHRCSSARAKVHTNCIIGLLGAALTLLPCLLQLWLALRVNRSRFTEGQIRGHYEYVMRIQAGSSTSSSWKDVWDGVKGVPRSFKQGVEMARRDNYRAGT